MPILSLRGHLCAVREFDDEIAGQSAASRGVPDQGGEQEEQNRVLQLQ